MKRIVVFIGLLCCVGATYARDAIKVLDIGVMGLASHDLFQWNGRTQQNVENGRLDLSTIFDYQDGQRIAQGGNPKNISNAPVYTITQTLVSFYNGKKQSLLLSGHFSDEQAHSIARKETVKFFIGMVKTSYPRFTGKEFPTMAQNGQVTNEEQAVMRALHDVLPGTIEVIRGFDSQPFSVTDYKYAMTFLSSAELSQPIKMYDGKYDTAYLNVLIPSRGGLQKINLKEQDQAFIETHTDYKLEQMLDELKRYGQQQSHQQYLPSLIDATSFGYHLQALFSKGLCKYNTDGSTNEWMLDVVECN
ncbi:hypothetical protein KCM76_11685 [Zooshikella marina]|uniref:hypothetical protein n=1 Tax=Zooshikella ganghwensis TaxID=202772 RepID=UPI000419F110|nr:hypothetical protein [Zooshikella ganghwensis]MBU2706645.1 hypothetical protein [Zooshikella ganghwensis]